MTNERACTSSRKTPKTRQLICRASFSSSFVSLSLSLSLSSIFLLFRCYHAAAGDGAGGIRAAEKVAQALLDARVVLMAQPARGPRRQVKAILQPALVNIVFAGESKEQKRKERNEEGAKIRNKNDCEPVFASFLLPLHLSFPLCLRTGGRPRCGSMAWSRRRLPWPPRVCAVTTERARERERERRRRRR